ncbi:MAG: 23S rRNA (adenine2503-C2)-methyltransferase [Limisphaerales bacterium]
MARIVRTLTALQPDIKNLSRDDLLERFAEWGEAKYRVDQILQWLYRQHASSFEQMNNVPKPLRARLAETYSLGTLRTAQKQGSADTTQKFLWQLTDGSYVESVLIPANPALYGESSDRHTLCVSTQVGCAYGCKFCASGLDGWKRNLTPSEIIEQVFCIERERPASADANSPSPRLVNNLVIMGMGEPLANYDNLIRALKNLNADWGGNIGARKITVSTSGLAPQIRKLADEKEQFRLAISLHGATDEVRSQIMPINRKYPLSELTAACEYYIEKKGKMITLEYILIAGINDAISEARPLAQLAERLNAKINLIPYNRVEGLPWERPPETVQDDFATAVGQHGVNVTLRREKGHDIDAACGQLRLKTERELTNSGC